jgi:hypothetical protein
VRGSFDQPAVKRTPVLKSSWSLFLPEAFIFVFFSILPSTRYNNILRCLRGCVSYLPLNWGDEAVYFNF